MTGVCQVGWCDEPLDHDGPHRRCVLDTIVFDIQAGPVPMLLCVQGESSRVRVLVLYAGPVELGLTWSQADQLAGALTSARRSYGGQ